MRPATQAAISSVRPQTRSSATSGLIVPAVNVIREGGPEPLLNARPTLSSSPLQWPGIALENYSVPAVLVPRHQHPEHFLHILLRGTAKYEVTTGGRNLRFTARPGRIFLLPRGTVDELVWSGPTQRVAVAMHPRLLTGALEEIAHKPDIELTEHWDLFDRHISALLLEMVADLEDSSPAGRIYGESLGNALAVYIMRRYAVQPIKPAVYTGGLPPYRLKRVLDYIANSLETNISLSELAAVAGMSPHYFTELFKQSTGRSPHNFVLVRRIERAKQQLCDPKRSIIDAGLSVGFQNPSHFARMFRKFVGASPSQFRAANVPSEFFETGNLHD